MSGESPATSLKKSLNTVYWIEAHYPGGVLTLVRLPSLRCVNYRAVMRLNFESDPRNQVHYHLVIWKLLDDWLREGQ